jgi:hypothetical protein
VGAHGFAEGQREQAQDEQAEIALKSAGEGTGQEVGWEAHEAESV